MKPGAIWVITLFAATVASAVSFKNFLGLQPALGMMLGLDVAVGILSAIVDSIPLMFAMLTMKSG